MSTILFELGTEELPPKNLKTLRDALASHVQTALEQAGIAFTAIKSYAAPRRLALQITGVAERQPDRVEQKRGPAVKAAFDRVFFFKQKAAYVVLRCLVGSEMCIRDRADPQAGRRFRQRPRG